ncbi:hypothetical protein ACFOVU_27290 [Nocardiopsis sediminis]|uniref:Alkaline shock response membrane anchor protein AmaP n=1 Tax=Nocardiopsis sediminis TaxID=1778267 RepID=A0ABV8FWX9_9ACTN
MTLTEKAWETGHADRWGLALLGTLLASGGTAALSAGLGLFGAPAARATLALGGGADTFLADWPAYAVAATVAAAGLPAVVRARSHGRSAPAARLGAASAPLLRRTTQAEPGAAAERRVRWRSRTGAGTCDGIRKRAVAAAPRARATAAEVSPGAARGLFEDEVGEYPGVRRARARMPQSRRDPHVRLDVTLDADADITAVWRRVRGEALENLRRALELERLPVVVRLSTTAPARLPGHEPA